MMEVRCERCQTEYEFEESLLSERGVSVKCTQCGHLFKVTAADAARSSTVRDGVTVPPSTPSTPSSPPASPPPVSAAWMLRQANGSVFSFGDWATLQRWIIEGKVNPGDEIARPGGQWQPLASIPELSVFFRAAAASAAVMPAVAPPARALSQPQLPPAVDGFSLGSLPAPSGASGEFSLGPMERAHRGHPSGPNRLATSTPMFPSRPPTRRPPDPEPPRYPKGEALGPITKDTTPPWSGIGSSPPYGQRAAGPPPRTRTRQSMPPGHLSSPVMPTASSSNLPVTRGRSPMQPPRAATSPAPGYAFPAPQRQQTPPPPPPPQRTRTPPRALTPQGPLGPVGEVDSYDDYLEVAGLSRRRWWLKIALVVALLAATATAGFYYLFPQQWDAMAHVVGGWAGLSSTPSTTKPAAGSAAPATPSAEPPGDDARPPQLTVQPATGARMVLTQDDGTSETVEVATVTGAATGEADGPKAAPSAAVRGLSAGSVVEPVAPEGEGAEPQGEDPAEASASAEQAAHAPAKDDAAAKPAQAKPKRRRAPRPVSFEGLLRSAHEHLIRGRAGNALRAYERAARMRPSSPAAQTGLGWCHINKGRPHIAVLKFERALQLDGRHGDALIGLGKAHRLLGHQDKARKAYERYVREHPTGRKITIAKAALEQLGRK